MGSCFPSGCAGIHSGCAGTVRSTKGRAIEVRPMETITINGFAGKTRDIAAAVTESTDGVSSRIGVCPRVVNMSNIRIPAPIVNVSAKAVTIPPNSLLCEPQEVSILRPCDTLPVPKVVTEQHTTNASLAAKEPTDSITKELGVDIPVRSNRGATEKGYRSFQQLAIDLF